jgi:hypothetical protein
MSLRITKFWSMEFQNFNGTSSEAKELLAATNYSEDEAETLILDGFQREERLGVADYRELWEVKESQQWVYKPITITFKEWKERESLKIEESKKDAEFYETVQIGDKIELRGENGMYFRTISEKLGSCLVLSTDGKKYRIYQNTFSGGISGHIVK